MVEKNYSVSIATLLYYTANVPGQEVHPLPSSQDFPGDCW